MASRLMIKGRLEIHLSLLLRRPYFEQIDILSPVCTARSVNLLTTIPDCDLAILSITKVD